MALAEQPLKIGIVGCGLAASNLHIPALTKIPETRVAAVSDHDLQRAEATGARFGIKASYSDPVEMVRQQGLDAVHVLTPPESHASVACAVMEAGAHALIEKPFAYTLEEVDRVVEKSRESGKRFSVVQNTLFHPAFATLRTRVAAGDVGEVCSAQFLSGRRDQTFVPDDWYFKTYGGRLGETLPHALYLLVELLPNLELVSAQARRLRHSLTPPGMDESQEALDELQALFSTKAQDAVASIYYSMNSNLPTTLVVTGTSGNLVAFPQSGTTLVSSDVEGVGAIGRPPKTTMDRIARKLRLNGARSSAEPTTHYRQIREFAQCLRSGDEFTVTAHKAREVVRLWRDTVSGYAGEP